LVASERGRIKRPRKRGGEETGPNPTDRGKLGTKHHIVVDRSGVPLAADLSRANLNDCEMLAPMLDQLPAIKIRRGRPRSRPHKLHADKAYDHVFCRMICRVRGIRPRIARRGIEDSQRLGRHRWVVERTIAWLHRFRRLAVRYERRADIHRGFLTLGAALVTMNFVSKAFC
jgi:transposase